MSASLPEILVKRIRAEYLEMPGLSLNLGQIQRLCGIDRSVCQIVLDSLVDAKFLGVSSDGHYARLTNEISRPRAGKAALRL
jgi:hypothetical protein